MTAVEVESESDNSDDLTPAENSTTTLIKLNEKTEKIKDQKILAELEKFHSPNKSYVKPSWNLTNLMFKADKQQGSDLISRREWYNFLVSETQFLRLIRRCLE